VNAGFSEKNGSYSRTTWKIFAYHGLGTPALNERFWTRWSWNSAFNVLPFLCTVPTVWFKL